jgi:PPOX class probable F420-dependent enzyme
MAFDDLTGQFISLTTFRRDGTPVPTTVWFARDGDHVIVGTATEAGKVKRIRAHPEVTMERSYFRGRTKGGTT